MDYDAFESAFMSATDQKSIPFNINNYVSVKLTKEGGEQWYRHHERFGIIGDGPEIDENGWMRIQLWELMQIFGSELRNGGPLMFETNILFHP